MEVENKPKILIVDDESSVLSAIKRCLRKIDAELYCFESPIKALEMSSEIHPDIVISDQKMPFMTGIDMLKKLKNNFPYCSAVLVSGFSDFNLVAEAFNQNIIQKYLSKPWDNDELRLIVTSAIEDIQKNKLVDEELDEKVSGFHGIITNDPEMKKIFDYIAKASKANIPVFISGETGTGKELIARAFYKEGLRNSSHFVAVNCANFSETLMESQLFGHTKGSFTGALRDQKGLLETAGEGILFLDEITCLPLTLQAKLLRIIQEREFMPVGSNKTIKFNAQIISASSTPLIQAVESGDFREDLYYRLNVMSVKLPPRRERGDDVVLLANVFLKRFNIDFSKNVIGFSKQAEQKLMAYDWPGNIRQLENLVHSLLVLNDEEYIQASAIDINVKVDAAMSINNEPQLEFSETLQDNQIDNITSDKIEPLWRTEKLAIEKAILLSNGNIPRAAAALEVSPSTLYRKIQGWKS